MGGWTTAQDNGEGFARDKSCYVTQIPLPKVMEERQKGCKDVLSHLTFVGRYPSAYNMGLV
eukprot:12648956-Ditylum_brightwellii.AAC.1